MVKRNGSDGRRLGYLVLQAGVLFFVGMGATCVVMPPAGPEPIFPADFRSTYTLVRDCRFSIEHDGYSIRVYVNEIGAAAYEAEAKPLPVGTIVVKEEFDANSCSNDAQLFRYSAMRKEAPGFDPDFGDWSWQRLTADRQVFENGKDTCIGCHSRPECVARDYMCTEP